MLPTRAPLGAASLVMTLAVLCLAMAAEARAQTTGQIRGTVSDPAGALLEDVTVLVENPRIGLQTLSTTTDGRGFFMFQALPPGDDFAVTLSRTGFARVGLSGVTVEAGRPTTLRTVMQPDPTLRETLQVRARPSIVALEETTGETRLSSEFIDALPILGRNYQDVLTLAPGVTDVDGDGNPNIHGARDTSVVTLVDGVSTTDPLTGKSGVQLNIESIQEIEIKTTGASAEFGRAEGGFVNIITKSGGNDFEGTFKFFWRGSALDGDGAGLDDPGLHGGLGEEGLRELDFDDLIGFLSLGGPIRRDRAWFFLSHESIRLEEPVNALNTAFVRGVDQERDFLKLTWQTTASQRLAFTIHRDPQDYLNEGLDSFTREEAGFTSHQGGTLLSLKDTAVLGPLVFLESTLSWFDGRPGLIATLDADTNGNGSLADDLDRNGFLDASERDSGEDYDGDGAFDVFEDLNRNHLLDPGEDLDGDSILDDGEDRDDDHRLDASEDKDGDGRLTPSGGCEGRDREDTDCDGVLDPDEDRNGNGLLDDTPRPGSPFPYGSLIPEPGDRDYTIDRLSRIVDGPFYQEWSDERERLTLREDLSVFVPDARGTHDVRTGFVLEREDFGRDVQVLPILAPRDFPECRKCLNQIPGLFDRTDARQDTIIALVPTTGSAHNEASAMAGGVYLQDTYKPLPNLSVGLGLRFDRETVRTSGYSFFEPAEEASSFDRLATLVGFESRIGDAAGNFDGIVSRGVLQEPLYQGYADPDLAIGQIVAPLRQAAASRLTRHHSEVLFTGEGLAAVFPEVRAGTYIDPARLVAHGILPQLPESFHLTNNNLMPRLALSWDPGADGRTKLFLTWGRYYDRLFLSTVVAEQGPDRVSRYYLLDADGFDDGVPNHRLGGVISRSPPSATQIDRGLQTPFSDEFTAGFEREIAPEVALSLTLVDRKYRQQLQDIDVNHSLRFDPTTGAALDILGENLCRLKTQIVCDIRLADGLPDLYIHNPFFNEVLRIGNFNEARYRAISLEVVRRLARSWQMQGSYTYSRAVGAAEDFQSRLGNDPSIVDSEFGYLDYDERHVVKLHTAMFLPRDWKLGVAATWGSGLPFSVVTRSFQMDNIDYPQFRTRYGVPQLDAAREGTPQFATRQRNSERNAPVYNIDVRLEKAFVLGRSSAALFLEVFNLLNSDDLRIIRYEPLPPDLFTEDDASSVAHVQVDGERRFGRRFQVGFQIGF